MLPTLLSQNWRCSIFPFFLNWGLGEHLRFWENRIGSIGTSKETVIEKRGQPLPPVLGATVLIIHHRSDKGKTDYSWTENEEAVGQETGHHRWAGSGLLEEAG